VIASVTTSVTLVSGLLMTVIDHKSFPSLGSGLWWAVQTVTTVGYGDVVPLTPAGRILAALVMLLGVGFLTVVTASITSSFVTQLRVSPPEGGRNGTQEELRTINERLEKIEARITGARSQE